MKFDPAKSYPHPVLRPMSNDYPQAEFQVEITLERVTDSTATRVKANFVLSDPDLLNLVATGGATYILLVRCPTTHLRDAQHSAETTIEQRYQPGMLSGRTEFCPFLVSTRELVQFRADGWHHEFLSQPAYDVSAGAVLATDYPKEYWIDTAPEASVGSIFELVESKDIPVDQWCCDLDGERVGILMSAAALHRFRDARARLNGTQDQAYLMNSVYMPALLHVLSTADAASNDYSDRRWYRSLDAKLDDLKRPGLGASATNRLLDAQELLERPFAQLPFQLDGNDGNET